MNKTYMEAIADFIEDYPMEVDLDDRAQVMRAIGVADRLYTSISTIAAERWLESMQRSERETA